MKLYRNILNIIIAAFILIIVITIGCKKEEEIIEAPIASFSINPPKGNTTTSFIFDASSTQISDNDSEILFRWDWDGDGNWDTPFSKSKINIYRFYVLGNYSPQMEARSFNGLSDTLQMELEIIQGYSPPVANFNYNPGNGHILTHFSFDASICYDDEDSLETLLFRWDWEGDGIWDTNFSNNPKISHQFMFPEHYEVTMQVKDPSGLSNQKSHGLDIDLYNPSLFVDFTISPDSLGTNEDIYTFDASASVDLDDPNNDLWYKWKVIDKNGPVTWETDFLKKPVISHRFSHLEVGDKVMKLEVNDIHGLTNSVSKEFTILPGNTPPNASFFIASSHGNTGTEFYFNANDVSDFEDYKKDLQIRWDFNNNGEWDTEFSTDKEIFHSYENPGNYEVVVEVIDSNGDNDISNPKLILISGGTNPTDLVLDERAVDPNGKIITDYYGSVKIGNQWWLSDNLNRSGYTDVPISKMCYSNAPANCELYGGLYTFWSVMLGNYNLGAQGACPNGWHVATPDDWDTLIEYIGGGAGIGDLEPGGSTDFYLMYGGIKDVNGSFRYINTSANFWTSKRANFTSNNAWSYTINPVNGTIETAVVSGNYGHSIRCIKD